MDITSTGPLLHAEDQAGLNAASDLARPAGAAVTDPRSGIDPTKAPALIGKDTANSMVTTVALVRVRRSPKERPTGRYHPAKVGARPDAVRVMGAVILTRLPCLEFAVESNIAVALRTACSTTFVSDRCKTVYASDTAVYVDRPLLLANVGHTGTASVVDLLARPLVAAVSCRDRVPGRLRIETASADRGMACAAARPAWPFTFTLLPLAVHTSQFPANREVANVDAVCSGTGATATLVEKVRQTIDHAYAAACKAVPKTIGEDVLFTESARVAGLEGLRYKDDHYS